MSTRVKISEADFIHVNCNRNIQPEGSYLLQQLAVFDWGPKPGFVPHMVQEYDKCLRLKHFAVASNKSKVSYLCVYTARLRPVSGVC